MLARVVYAQFMVETNNSLTDFNEPIFAINLQPDTFSNLVHSTQIPPNENRDEWTSHQHAN